MSLRLSALVSEERDVDLGYGVSVRIRPVTFAGMKAAEHAAFRLARTRLGDAGDLAGEAVEDPEATASYVDRINGLANEIMLDALVEEFAVAWRGVEAEDGSDEPLNRKTWSRFRELYPFLANVLHREFQMPAEMLESEGNGSAPSPGT